MFFLLCTATRDYPEVPDVSDWNCRKPKVRNEPANFTEPESSSVRENYVAFDNILKRSLLPVNNNHMHLNKCLV
jgi:hypothetical protein